jgi:hypothetical protein
MYCMVVSTGHQPAGGFSVPESPLQADAERNRVPSRIATPVHYVRGDADHRPIEPYLDGLRAGGVQNLTSRVVPNTGELIPIADPNEFADVVREFGTAVV